IDVAIVAATSASLEAAMRQGEFLDALYHRLSVLTLSLLPLRERGADIALLANHFLARACTDYHLPEKTLDPDAIRVLRAYAWPGNVRELANLMERVALTTDLARVTADLLGLPTSKSLATDRREDRSRLRTKIDDVERDQIEKALRAT